MQQNNHHSSMISQENELDILETHHPLSQQPEPQIQSVLHKIDQVSHNHKFTENSLEYDIRLGWLPRSQITGPIPLSFTQHIYDQIILKKAKELIYIGYRPSDTFQMHSKFYESGNNYPFYQFHLCKAQFLKRFFKKYYSDYDFTGNRQAQMILQDSPLHFDSCFQTGNLDAVYYEQNEYRLLLRVDSNTIGHCNYYNFRVIVKKPGRYIFRIMNINKEKSLYERGMKPYIRWLKNQKWTQFHQIKSSNTVRFISSPLNEQFQLGPKLFSLKFEYQFEKENTYQFSYTIPFGYSDLLKVIKQNRSSPYLHVGKLCHTLSGIEIPLLTVTKNDREYGQEENTSTKNMPYVVLITGRVHPSEANGSHIVNGILKGLLDQSAQSRLLRKQVIFKIIPMINPDGVIIGNTRTSFSGKDLNRKYYKSKNQVVFPEILGIMDYAHKLKARYKQNFLFIIDIHGHSTRKNSFFYGPEYSIMDEQFSKCRLLPKYMSQRTEIFRYFLCKFKVNNLKAFTARGYFNSIGIKTYTHQTSMHCYFNFNKRQDDPFTRNNLQELGINVVQSMFDYVRYTISGIKDIKLEQQLKTPVIKRIKGVDYNAEDQDSQALSSDKADSQDEGQDVEEKKLQQFFSKINENKYYFYQQLSAQQKNIEDFESKQAIVVAKEQKKSKKIELNSSREDNQKNQIFSRMKLQQQLIQKKTKVQKIDWALKANYPVKRQKNYLEYPKLANVIFGSSIPNNFFKMQNKFNQYKKAQQGDYQNQMNNSRYSIKYIEAQFKATSIKYPSPQPKIYKSLKPSNSIKHVTPKRNGSVKKISIIRTEQKDKQIEKQKAQILLQLKKGKESKPILKEIPHLYSGPIQTATKYSKVSGIKVLPICSVDLQNTDRSVKEKQMMRLTNSLKVLTRKKSIKSIHQSKEIMNIKASKSLKNGSLTKILPPLYNKLNKG